MDLQLRELKGTLEELKVISEKQAGRVRYHETKVQNITIAYLMWERLFFLALSQILSSLKCSHWWMIFALSLSCTFVYFVLFVDAVIMLYRTQYQLENIYKEQAEIYQEIRKARRPSPSIEAGDASDGFGFGSLDQIPNFDQFRIIERKVFIYTTVCALLAVTALELYVFKCLMCN